MNEAEMTRMLLRGARLILSTGVVEGKSLVVERGLIARIVDEDELRATERALDLKGLTLFPGFIDVHIHGAVGVDTMQANAADLDRVSQFLATRGVTGWPGIATPDRDRLRSPAS